MEWRDIVAFRNLAVHAAFSVDWSIVWATAVRDVSALLTCLRSIAAEEALRTDD